MNPWTILGWLIVACVAPPVLILIAAMVYAVAAGLYGQWLILKAKMRLRRTLRRTLDAYLEGDNGNAA